MLDIYRKISSFLDDKSRIQIFFFIPLLLLSSVMEIASVASILPLIKATFGQTNFGVESLPWASRFLAGLSKSEVVYLFSFIFIVIFIIKNVLIFITTYAINRFCLYKQAKFQQLMFKLYAHRPYPFHLRRNTAMLLRDLSSGVGTAFEGLRLTMTLIMDFLLMAAACVVLFVMEPLVSLIIGPTLVVIGLIIYKILAPLLQRWGALAYSLEAKILQSINQSFGAIKEIKVLNCQSYFLREFADQTNSYVKTMTLSITANQSPRLLTEIFIIMGFLGTVIFLFEVYGNVEEVFSTVGLFGMAALRLMPSINRILSGMTDLKHRTALVDSVYKDFRDGQRNFETIREDDDQAAISFHEDIVFKDLEYSYETGPKGKKVLSEVNFSIMKGDAIGIVGPSGSGKTTLTDILMCLLHPEKGTVLIDGVDAFSKPLTWQKKIGYVPQQIYLIDDTVRRNIAFGIDDADIDDQRLQKVAKMANLERVISELSLGFDTILGEQGIRLSGGQRQRIGIARALYRDPEVIVFDEATSALDSETEHEISKAITGLMRKKTIIIIAHRLSTVRICDKLIFVREGRISDIGKFDDLMERNTDFNRMVELSKFGNENSKSSATL